MLMVALLAGIEFSNTLRQALGHGLLDPLIAGLFVFAVFGSLSLLAGLVTLSGRQRLAALTGVYLCLALLGVVLFFSWAAFWITGKPVNTDAMSILVDSPFEALLHLLSSDPLFLLALVAALAAVLYALYWLVRLSLRAAPEVPYQTRALLCVLLGALAGFAGVRLAGSQDSRSSYAAFIAPHGAAEMVVNTYSCPRSPRIPIAAPGGSGRTNGAPVIVLMMESLRSDFATKYAEAMPNVASYAKDSLVFDRAYATSSHSDYEDLSFWYSRYPLRADHRMGYPRDAAWRGISVFEYFKQHGYSTAYFSSQNEKWGDMVNWLKIPSVDTYFDSENFTGETWENPDDNAGLIALIRAGYARSGKVEDSRTLGFAADWVEKHANEPFFIGLNLQNTHYHYFIPENGKHPYTPDKLGFAAVYSAWPANQAPVVRNRYLNAAYNMDAAVGEFVERLKRAGVWDKAIVLMIGDGGEAFYEHGFGNHSGPMYEEVARTLAVLKLPKGDARNGTHWERPVSHVDFVPALVQLAGMDTWSGFQGTSPWLQSTEHPVYLTVNALVRENSVIEWPWKLMVRQFPEPAIELYNLETDPTESQNAVEHQQHVALEMLDQVQSYRSCQISYYADAQAHTRFQPPRFEATPTPRTAVR